MNIQCSRCGHQNSSDLKFCTNCGNPLSSSEPATVLSSAPPTAPPGARTTQVGASISPKGGKTGRNLAIFGGLGCLLLLGAVLAVIGLLYYIGTTDDNRNVALNNGNTGNVVNANSNRGATNSSKSNTSVNKNTNVNSSPANNDNKTPEEEMRNFLPSTVGGFERQGDVEDGDVTEDFSGADKIVKTQYAKKGKPVNVVLAQFSSPATAKESYGYLLDGFKKSGATIRAKQKIKNKAGVETGEIAFYSYKGTHETMFYADKYGFRIFSKDQKTLVEFIQDFGKYVDMFDE